MFRKIYEYSAMFFKKFDDISLLFLRVILSYGFFDSAIMKWNNMNAVIEWFTSLEIPAPAFNAYLVSSVELIGVVTLVLGIMVRQVALGLMAVVTLMIFSVHIQNGFSALNHGFEIPLYYLAMLFILLTQGGGKLSLEYSLFKKQITDKEKK